jgi:hypothetical protein
MRVMMTKFAAALGGGDRRSIGNADCVTAAVRAEPKRFDELWTCLAHDDPLVRMRASDAIEKVSRDNPALLQPHKRALLERSLDDGTPEMRWHLIAIASRLSLKTAEADAFCSYLDGRLRHDPSRIVKVMALQAAFELGVKHPALASNFQRMLTFAQSSPWPSVRARANKLSVPP